MQVILLEKIHNLGDLGDQVRVKAGYGRNYLLPQGKAVPATEKNVAKFEVRRVELEAKAADTLQAAEARAAKLEGLEVVIEAMASEEEKLYGSVGNVEIAEAMDKMGHEVEKREILLPDGPIRQLGEYEIQLQLHGDVSAAIKVVVKAAEQK